MTSKELTQTKPTSPIPRKLNPSMITALSKAIANGNYAVTACKLCNISENTFHSWKELGQHDEDQEVESIYLELLRSIKRAEADSEAKMVAVVREAATEKKEWLPAMTYLERRHPDRWGRKDRTRVDINERKTITITHVEVVLNQGEGKPEIIEGEGREIKRDVIEQGEK